MNWVRASWIVALSLLAITAIFKCLALAWGGDLPNVRGALNPAVTQATIRQTICVPGWTTTVRPPTSVTNKIKRRMLAGLKDQDLSHYELDHLVSLQLGGALVDERNLWVESYAGSCGARVKDVLETNLKRRVCAGTLTLVEAQQAIMANWVVAYNRYVGHLECAAPP